MTGVALLEPSHEAVQAPESCDKSRTSATSVAQIPAPSRIGRASWWVGVRDRSGVRDFRFRDIRHTFATRFINDGGDIHELAAILGVKLGAAGTYVHLTIEQLHDEIGRGKHRKEFDACSE
jgi:integrase